jgi:hypothetical protein
MKYDAPKDIDGHPYYVPVVTKNRDYLMGYISGLDTAKDMIKDVLASININVDLGAIDVLLDSTRFNDILENGRYESEMTDKEKKDYIFDIVEEVTEKLKHSSTENNVLDDAKLRVECSCGLGFYFWDEVTDIPKSNFSCHNCGKILIHYTGIYDGDFKYCEGRDKNE